MSEHEKQLKKSIERMLYDRQRLSGERKPRGTQVVYVTSHWRRRPIRLESQARQQRWR